MNDATPNSLEVCIVFPYRDAEIFLHRLYTTREGKKKELKNCH